jgi:transcription initiation factor IIF auxiliary subunit
LTLIRRYGADGGPYSKHPTFVPPELTLTSPPYRVTRIGWGYFGIDVTLVLKPGYLWHKGNGRLLKLEWDLDFDGFGSSASYDYAVIIENGKVLN